MFRSIYRFSLIAFALSSFAACSSSTPSLGGSAGPGSSDTGDADDAGGGGVGPTGARDGGASGGGGDAAAGCGSICSQALLFGGNSDGELGDTWTWDGTKWTQQMGAGPSPRLGAAGAPLGPNVVLFGGYDGSFLGDTWSWNGSTWTQVSSTGPSVRAFSMVASLRGKLVLFGGEYTDGTGASKMLGDTWQWDGSTWTLASTSGPSPRKAGAVAVMGGKLVLFGGSDGTNDLADTWIWDGAIWSAIPAGVVAPPAAKFATASTWKGKVLMVDAGKTYEFDGKVWSDVATSGPTNRTAAATASLGDQVVLFGGTPDGDKTQLADMWTWSSHWTQVSAAASPPPREEATFVGPEQTDNETAAAYATPVVVAPTQASPASVVGDGTNVYWTSTGDGTVKSQPVGGGPITTLASGQGGPKGLSFSDTYDKEIPPTATPILVWANSTAGTIASVPLAGGTPTTVVSGQHSPDALSAYAGQTFWVNDGDSTVRGGGVQMNSGTATPLQIAYTTGFNSIVFWSDAAGNLNAGGFDPVTHKANPSQVWKSGGILGVAVDQDTTGTAGVYYSLVTPATIAAKTSSIVVDAFATATTTTLASGLTNPADIAVDSTNLYFSDATEGKIMTVSKTGGALFTLASGENAPRAIAVDATNVYWIDAAGNVRKVAK